MSGALISSAITSQGRPPRIKRQKLLLSSCAVAAALAVGGHSTSVRAQAFAGTPATVSGTVSFSRTTPNFETITVDSPTAIVNWTPTDTAIGGGAINYLPSGATARYTSTSGTDFTILNRILPTDSTRPVAFNGTVLSNFIPASGPTTPLGSVWFYSPGGILAGPTAVFDVGSLVLTAADIDVTGGLFGPGNTIRFRGATDSRAAIDIQAGAQITASNEGSYVALVAPRINQAGTVNVNGSAAYVAAESVDISINAGLFDFTVITGSNVNAGGETTLSHTGTTTGPAPTSGTDPHAIYLVNMPKNDAVTMLLTGSAGFAAAATAGVENGVVVLAAGANVASASNGVGGVDITGLPGPTNGQNASLEIENAIVTSRIGGIAATDATAYSGSGGSLTFASDVNLAAGRAATLSTDGAGTVTVGGGVQLTTFNVGPGEASIRAITGTMTIAGAVTLTANETAASGDATAGTAAIEANGATISIGGTTQLLATGTGGSGVTGGNGTGGTASVSVNGGSLAIDGNLVLVAEGQGGSGTTLGGNGQGGTTSVSITNGSLSATGSSFMVARGLGGNGASGGNGVGGIAVFLADDGSFQLGISGEPDALQMAAGGLGGTADDGGTAGNGTGGSATFASVDTTPDATPSTITVSMLTIGAAGTGGSFTGFGQAGGNGGTGTGGGVALTIGAGDITADSVTLIGDGIGSNGNNAVDSVNGGNGGAGTGGGANLSITGGSLTVQSLSMTANATGGDGGNVFESGYGTPGGSGGAGGNAIAGNVTAGFSGGTVLGGALSLEATGFGGAGGSSSETAGSAGFGRGATAEARVIGGQITFDSVDIVADGDGGDGGDSANQTIGSAGGAGQAGIARFAISSGSATITSSLSIGGGEAGEAGRGGFGANFVQAAGAGASNGGISELLVSGGTLTAGQTAISATAVGVGDSSQLPGGDVRGGSALLDISGGSASFTSTMFVSASAGQPGEPEAAGAATFGGSAAVSLSNGVTATFASGLDVRSDAANGPAFDGAVAAARGGSASVTVDGTLDLGANTLFVSANGFGSPSPLIGGAAAGGNASVTLSGGSIIASTASVIADASGAPGNSVFGSGPDAGAAGSATGGDARLTITGGSFLPTSLTISAIGTGGNGGDANDGPNAGAGGSGQGGTASLIMSGGTLGDATLSSISLQGFGFGGEGGDALETGYGASGNGGAGGSSTGGTASISITGGALIATSIQADPWSRAGEGGSSVSGNGGNGGSGTGGSGTFLIDGAATSVTVSSVSLFGDGNGALGGASTNGIAGTGGTGTGGVARLEIRDGTVDIDSLFFETGLFTGASNDAIGGTSELLVSGGTTALGSANLSSRVFVNSNQQRDGAVLRGGTSRVSITGGSVSFTSGVFLDASAIFENDGVPFLGGNAFGGNTEFSAGSAASVTYPATIQMFADARGGLGGASGIGGDATGGSAILNVADGTLGIFSASALAAGGAGSVSGGDATGGSVTVTSTDGLFNLASISLDLTASGGVGLDGSASGAAGGDGGAAAGGMLKLGVAGSGAELNITDGSADFLATAGTGGNGASGTTGGAGGKGGNATGGAFEIAADLGSVTINNVDGNGPFVELNANAGVGGDGGDGSDAGNSGGIGGDGGSATGGTARITVNGGAVNLGASGVRANGTGATGGAGGIGAGTLGAASGIDGTGMGGLVAVNINDGAGGEAGSAMLGATQIDVQGFSFNGEFGDQVGRVELYDNGSAAGGGLTLASLNIFDGGTLNTSDQAVDFFAASRRITITGDAGIQTPGFVYFRATGTGGTDIGGSLGVTSGGSIILDHTGQPATPAATVNANDIVFIANGGPFQGSADSLVTANQRLAIQANGDVTVGTAKADLIVIRGNGGAVNIGSATSTGTSTTLTFDPIWGGNLASGIHVNGPSGITAGDLTAAVDVSLVSTLGDVDVGQIDAGRFAGIFSGFQQNGLIGGDVRLGSVQAGGLFFVGDLQAVGLFSPTFVPLVPIAGDISITGPVNAGSAFMATDGALTGNALTATTGEISLLAGSMSFTDMSAALGIQLEATGAIDATSLTAGTSGNFSVIEVFTNGTVNIGALASDAGDVDIEGDAGVTVGAGSAGHALTLSSENGSVTAGALTTGSVPNGGFEDFDGVGIEALTGIAVGPVSSGFDVGMVSLGDISVASITAERNVVMLPGGSLNLGAVTAGNRFYVANASMRPVVEPDPDAPVDLTALDGVAFDPIGGNAAIGPISAGVVRMAIGGNITVGPASSGSDFVVDAASSITLDGVTAADELALTSTSAIIVDNAQAASISATGTDVTLNVVGNLDLTDITASGSATLSADSISLPNSFTAGGNVSLTSATNISGGSIAVGGSAQLRAIGGDVATGDISAPNGIKIRAGGDITTGAIQAGMGASLIAIGNLSVGNITANAPISSGAAPFVQGVTLSSGGNMTIGDMLSSNSIIVGNMNGALGVGDVESVGGVVRLSSNTSLSVGNVRAAGSIYLTSLGAITAGDLTAGTGPLLPNAIGSGSGSIGGGAVDPAPAGIAPGFDGLAFERCLDCARSALLPDGFIVNYFGTEYSETNISDHGYITFDGLQDTFTPEGLGEDYAGFPIIAAFFADVDIRNEATGGITYGEGTFAGRQAFGVTWRDVGYFSSNADKLNTFQLILTNRADTGAGNFDIYFNYADINWETGADSGGVNGLGGISAAVGFNAGTGNDPGTFFQLEGSLMPGSFLNGGPNELRSISNNGNPGQLLFPVRNGAIASGPPEAPTIHVSNAASTTAGANITLGNVTAEAVEIHGAGEVQVGNVRTADLGSGLEAVSGPDGFARGDILIDSRAAFSAPDLEAIGAVTVTSDGAVSLTRVAATSLASVRTEGTLAIAGPVTAEAITLASADIAIAPNALIGNAATQTISLENLSEGPTFVGGSDTEGWTLSNAEFGRLQAHDIDIFGTFDTAEAPDVIVRDLTVNGSAFEGTSGRANLLGSTLSIRAVAGSMRVEGAINLRSAGADDVLQLSAQDQIQVVTPTGSIAITDANGGLAGTLRMEATRVFVGSSAAFDDVFPAQSTTQPTISEIDARLAINDGEARPEGYLQAGAMRFAISDSLFIQNSGSSSDAGSADRAGFTVGGGGVSIATSGAGSAFVINGRQATGDEANPFVTGRDVIPVVSVTSSSEGGGFDQGSSINGCVVVSTTCGFGLPPEEMAAAVTEATNTPSAVIDDVIRAAEEEANDGTQVIQQLNLPLIRFVDFSGLGFTPVIDEPVTGTGNDDLWMGGPGGGQ